MTHEYRKYVWNFFSGPGALLPLVGQEEFEGAARVTFAHGTDSGSALHSHATHTHEGACCLLASERGGCCRPSSSSFSPQCPCLKRAQGGLVWSVMTLGAHVSGDREQASAFEHTSRHDLMLSLCCAGEVTVKAFFILAQYHYGLGQTHLAFRVIKKALTILRTLESPAPGTRSLSEILCLLLHIPLSRAANLPLRIDDSMLADFEGLLSSDIGSPYLPTRENARCACLKLVAEAAGRLANAGRQRGVDFGRSLLLLATRNAELCRQIHAVWQPFGPMNSLMEVVYDAIYVWAVACVEKFGYANDVAPGAEKVEPQGDNGGSIAGSTVDRNIDYFLSFLQALSGNSRISLTSPPPPAADDADVPKTVERRRGEITALCRGISSSLSRNPRSGFLPPIFLSIFYNSFFLMAEWGLWDDLAGLDSFFQEMGALWPVVVQPNDQIKKATESSSQGRTQWERTTSLSNRRQDGGQDFMSTFWDSTDDESDMGEFLRELGVPPPEQKNPFDFWN